MSFLSPRLDVVFKALFANEKNKGLLSSLLSSVLKIPKSEFSDLQILNGELSIDQFEEKRPQLDVRLRLASGIEIDIEIQLKGMQFYHERILYYWAKMYSAHLVRGDKYETLNRCVIINFLDFNLFDYPKMHSVFHIREDEEGLLLTKHLEIHYVELKKRNDYNISREDELFVEWTEFLNMRNEGEMEYMKNKELPDDIKKAIEELEELSKDPSMKAIALSKEMAIHDYMQRMSDAEEEGLAIGLKKGIEKGIEQGIEKGIEQGIEKGIEQGIEKGIEQGIEKGIEQGIEKGIEQGIEKGIEQGIEKGIEQGIEKGIEQGIEKGIEQGIEKGIEQGTRDVAWNMLKQGFDVSIISKATGLSEAKIKEIQLINEKELFK